MKAKLTIFGMFAAAFLVTAIMGNAYGLEQENKQKAAQLQKSEQENEGDQAGIKNTQLNLNKQNQKSENSAWNNAKCVFVNRC